MPPSDYVYGVTLSGLSINVTPHALRNFFSYASNNISFGATSPAANDTIIVEINVCSKEELDRILGSKMQLEGAGIHLGQPSISHRPTPLLSPSNSLTGLPPSHPVLQSYTLPASPPVEKPSFRPSKVFQPVTGLPEDQPKNVYVLNLPLDMTQGEFEAVFSQFGRIEHACLLSMLDTMGRRRGFLLMASYEEACNLVNKTQGRTLKGCRLEVSWAQVQKGSHLELNSSNNRPTFSRFQPPPSDPQADLWYDKENFSPAARSSPFSNQYASGYQQNSGSPTPSGSPQPNMNSTTVIAEGLCAKTFPSIEHVIRSFLPRGDVTGAVFLPDNTGQHINPTVSLRSASVTFATLREAANAVSWMHGRFYGGKQIRVRWEGEAFARKPRRPGQAPERLDYGQGQPRPMRGETSLPVHVTQQTPMLSMGSLTVTMQPPFQMIPQLQSRGNQPPVYSGNPRAEGLPTVPDISLGGNKLLPLMEERYNSHLAGPARRGSAISDRSYESAFPTALTPMSWTGSENKTAPPSPGSFTPFSPILGDETESQQKVETDVLGILAGLSCEDDDEEEEENAEWAGAKKVKDYGPIGKERLSMAAA